MAIIAYCGYPRHGKSYSAVEQVILPAVRQGRVVVTNLPLRSDVICRDFPRADVRVFPVADVQARPDSIFDHCPNGAVIVLDELWRLWPSGMSVARIPEPFKTFLAEHGHRVDAGGNSQQIVFVSQDLNQIAAFARQLVEETFITRKLTQLGMAGRFRTDVYRGHPTGLDPPESARVRQIPGKYRPEIYQYYVSHTMSESEAEGANEASLDGRGNVWKRPVVWVTAAAILLLPIFGVWELVHGGKTLGLAPRRAVVGGSASAGVGAAAVVRPVLSPVARGRWWVSVRLAGLCFAGRCGWAVVTDGTSSKWVSLRVCRDFGFEFRCRVPGGVWVSDADAPAGPPAGGPAERLRSFLGGSGS